MTSNKHVQDWIRSMADMVQPKDIVWIDGSEEQAESLRRIACSTGELIKLNEEKYPNCYLHRTAVNDVARVEGRTFICTRKKEDAGNINNWMDPQECYAKLTKLYTDYRKDRPMVAMWSQDWTLPEVPAKQYSDKLISDAKDFSDEAVITITRVGGEGADLPTNMKAKGITYNNNSKD